MSSATLESVATTRAPAARPRIVTPNWLALAAACWELTKPRISFMVLLTVLAGALATGRPVAGRMLLHALLGTALVAAGASAANQWLERGSDARMPRTKNRPLPTGVLGSAGVLAFTTLTSIGGLAYMAAYTPTASALTACATWVLYVAIYTPLKRRTPANTAVGAVAGALPVWIGWTSTGAPLDAFALSWLAIVYLWQFPHFMAIAWLYREEYRAAGLLMLTVVDASGRSAGLQAVAGAAALLPISMLPLSAGTAPGPLAACVLIVGLAYLFSAVGFLLCRDERSAGQLLRVSLVHLPSVMVLLVAGA